MYDECWTEADYASVAVERTRSRLCDIRAEINSGMWTGASVRLAELRREEAELDDYLSSLRSE